MVIAPTVVPSTGDHGPYEEVMAGEMRKEENKIKESIADFSRSEEVPWRLGKPEVVIPLAVRHYQEDELAAGPAG
ncbi:MAG: hypothetical protein R3F11_22035 [Verrucomicrobiales bacterium]